MKKFKNLKIVLVTILMSLKIINSKIFYCSNGRVDFNTVFVKGNKNITTTTNQLSFYVKFKSKCGNPFVISENSNNLRDFQDPQDLQDHQNTPDSQQVTINKNKFNTRNTQNFPNNRVENSILKVIKIQLVNKHSNKVNDHSAFQYDRFGIFKFTFNITKAGWYDVKITSKFKDVKLNLRKILIVPGKFIKKINLSKI